MIFSPNFQEYKSEQIFFVKLIGIIVRGQYCGVKYEWWCRHILITIVLVNNSSGGSFHHHPRSGIILLILLVSIKGLPRHNDVLLAHPRSLVQSEGKSYKKFLLNKHNFTGKCVNVIAIACKVLSLINDQINPQH